MARKILEDSNGHFFCGACGATRSKRGQLWTSVHAVLAHLKHCKGEEGLAQEREEIRTKLASVHIVTPDQDQPQPSIPVLPATLPASRTQESNAIPALPASVRTQGDTRSCAQLLAGEARNTRIAWRPAARRQPAPQGYVTEADYDSLVDKLNLVLIERDEALQLADRAVAQNNNHTPHLALAKQSSSNVILWVLGGAVVLLIGYHVVSAAQAKPKPLTSSPAMNGHISTRKAPGGVVDILDMGSKGLTFFSKARNAFKI